MVSYSQPDFYPIYEIKPIKPMCQRGIAGLMGFMNGAYGGGGLIGHSHIIDP